MNSAASEALFRILLPKYSENARYEWETAMSKKSKDRLRDPSMRDHATYPSTFLTHLYENERQTFRRVFIALSLRFGFLLEFDLPLNF